MKFLASTLLAFVLVPVESALGQQRAWDKLTQLSPGTKIEALDPLSGTIQGQLVAIANQSLTLRRKDKELSATEPIARADVVSVTVKRPTLKRIALLAGAGSVVGALAGGSRSKGPMDYNSIQGAGCRNPNGYYFNGTGGAIGAGAGAALGLLGFAFPSKKLLYEHSLIAKGTDFSCPSSSAESAARKESSLQLSPGSAGDKGSELDHVVPAKTDCETKLSEKGHYHVPQE